jgi:hypothetical protein
MILFSNNFFMTSRCDTHIFSANSFTESASPITTASFLTRLADVFATFGFLAIGVGAGACGF